MVQSVELLLDERSETAVRRDWARLVAAGLPSQARHTAASNRPHITLAATSAIDPAAEPALAVACGGLPLPVRLGALTLFGHGRFVLVRSVVADLALLDLQRRIHELVGTDRAGDSQMAPGRWVPHVTLAHRLTAAQVAEALEALGVLEVLGGSGDVDGHAVAARRWDGDAKREWRLAP